MAKQKYDGGCQSATFAEINDIAELSSVLKFFGLENRIGLIYHHLIPREYTFSLIVRNEFVPPKIMG